MAAIRYAVGDHGGAVRDIQRKLASLHSRGEPALEALQAAPCSGHYDAATAAAVNAFKAKYRIGTPDGICDQATWEALNERAGSVFAETWQFELDAIRGPIPEAVSPVREKLVEEVHDQHLAGLAFSGGGIRSATFNLGMLQALAELRMLRDFDYLSTVSGGGYIGAWFSKWLKQRDGNIVNLERELTPGSPEAAKREPEEVKFLRQYTNYLTPKTGVFSADTWSLLATYVRNTVLNLTILVALLAMVMIVPRLLVTFVESAIAPPPSWTKDLASILGMPPFAVVAAVAVLWAVFWIAASVATRPETSKAGRLFGQSQSNIILLAVVPLMLAAFFGSVALWESHKEVHDAWEQWPAQPAPIVHWLYVPGLAYFVAWGAGWGLAQFRNWRSDLRAGRRPPQSSWRELRIDGPGHLLCAVAAFAVGALMVIMVTSALHTWHVEADGITEPGNETVAMVAFGMPILLNLFGITMILCVGLVGRLYTDKSREWWSRQSGWVAIFVMAWLALVTVSLYAPPMVEYVHTRFGPQASGLLGSAWLGTTLTGLIIGKSSATGAPGRQARFEWLARIAPLIFSIGALCLVSTGLHLLLQSHEESHPKSTSGLEFNKVVKQYSAKTPYGDALHAVNSTAEVKFTKVVAKHSNKMPTADANELWLAFIGLGLLGGLLAWRVDINKFSLHMMYRNRLVRAYLGATNADRQPHPFTGFDPADEVNLDELLGDSGKLQRPYHIINTALNLVNGKELAWQTRKAAGFTFTPAFCGFELPSMASPGGVKLAHEALRGGFRRTSSYRPKDRSKNQLKDQLKDQPKAAGPGRKNPERAPRHEDEIGINLGMAVAVSGAAASPNMGFNSSPPLAFLMTLFNVRLGRWFANPIRPSRQHLSAAAPGKPPRTSPRVGLWYLLKELFGLTDAKANFVYLSDGGHFENLGVYELVRRRCQLIIAVDAGADGQFSFEDLGNAIRKCGTDLNVEIEIDVGQIDLRQQAEFSKSHCVTGQIRYDKVDQGAPVGTLLYIKPSLLGTEFADVLNYRKTNKRFPHQPTADQWFDETQFETYRSLGYNIGKIALAKAAKLATKNTLGRHDIKSLCEALRAVWDQPESADRKVHPPGLILVENRRMTHRRMPQVVPDPAFVTAERRQCDRRQA